MTWSSPTAAKPREQPVEIVHQRRRGEGGHAVEGRPTARARRRGRRQRIATATTIGRLPRVDGKVVPGAGDVGDARLRRLGEGPQRAPPRAPDGSRCRTRGRRTRRFARPRRQQKLATPTSLVVSQMRTARSAAASRSSSRRHSGSVTDDGSTARRSRASPVQPPQGGGVALHHLAEAVADRLEQMVAGGQAVRAGLEAAAARRQRQRVVGADQLERNPDRLRRPRGRVPRSRGAAGRVEAAARCAGSRSGSATRCSRRISSQARELQRLRDVLRVPELGRLHEARRLGGREGQPLALRHGDRAGVGPDDHHHRDPDAVEAGHVGDAGDAHGASSGRRRARVSSGGQTRCVPWV